MTWVPGENLLIKLWDTLADKGMGNLLKPWQIRREAKALLDVRLEERAALADLEDKIKEKRKAALQLPPPSEQKLLTHSSAAEDKQKNSESTLSKNTEKLLTEKFMAEALARDIHVAKAILHAEEILEQDHASVPEKPVDPDWLERWRDSAAFVSSDELQTLWGKLLAGEIKSPGSFSLRTMDFIKNLSSSEAQKIALLFKYVINGIIYRDEEFLSSIGITYGFLLNMQELGILSGVEALGITMTWETSDQKKFVRALINHDRIIVAEHDDVKQKLTLKACQLTSIGKELLKIGVFEADENYISTIAKQLNADGFKIKTGNCKPYDSQQVSVSNMIDYLSKA